MLRRDRWSTLAIAVTLALGIGATTATYAVFNAVLFRPTPGVHGESDLFTVLFQPPAKTATAYGSRDAVPALRQAASGVESLAYDASASLAVATSRDVSPSFEDGLFVTSQFFSAIGARVRLGRLLTDAEADTGSANVAVVSEHFWKTKLGGAADVVGRTLAVNGKPFEVVGVIAEHRGWSWTSSRVGTIDLWLPIGLEKLVSGSVGGLSVLYGRRRDGASFTVIEQQLQAAYASVNLPARDRAFVPFVYPGIYTPQAEYTRKTGLRLYWLLMGGVALLLLLSCANAANLLLARAVRRERETAVRLAIGASRWRIVRGLLAESAGIAALAGVVGLGVAIVLATALSDLRLLSWLPALERVDLDRRVLAFSLFVTSATVLVFGLVPAFVASRTNVLGALGRSTRSVAGPPRLRNVLVAAQIALSLTLVAGAGVLNRSQQLLFSTDLGLDAGHVFELSLRPEYIGYDRAKATHIVSDTFDALKREGFRNVAISYPGPLWTNAGTIAVRMDGATEFTRKTVVESSITPAYFDLLKIPVVSGRAFSESEFRQPISATPMPVIVNETMARDLFPGQPAVGRTFELERYIGMATIQVTAEIVGVARDARSSAVRTAPRPALFHMRQAPYRWPTILVRGDGPDGAVIEQIRNVVRRVDPALPITALAPLADEVAESLSEDRVLARVSALVAIMAALLAATGVFAVISQVVTERRRDFGIRTALGASVADIVRHVLRGVLVPVTIGIAVGLGLYWLSSRWLETRLFGVRPLDPMTVTLAVVVLISLSVTAALLPARRASRVDPVVALRAE